MTPDVCVVGSFMMDLVLRAPRRPQRGETVIGTSFQMFLGGKGFNQAVAAVRAGASTAMVGRLGDDDFGQKFLDKLSVEGIDHTAVSIDPSLPTGVGVPLVEDTGDNSIVVIPLANHAITIEQVRDAASLIRSSRVLLIQLELPVQVALEAARLARPAGTTVVLNPAPAVHDLAAFRGLVDFVVPNESEAKLATGIPCDDDSVAASAERLLALTSATGAVLTLGPRGCLIAADGHHERVAGWQTQAVDTVGAGDAFCGGFAAGLASGMSLLDAVRYGNAAGAIACTRPGAEPSMPSRSEVLDLLRTAAGADANATRSISYDSTRRIS